MERTELNCAVAFLTLFMVVGGIAEAQDISSKYVHEFNIGILDRLDDLERLSSFTEISDKKSFVQLFENSELPSVYNDLAGTPGFQRMLTPVEYVSLIPNDGNYLLKTDFYEVKKEGDVYEKEGKIHRSVAIRKSVMSIDATVYTKGQGGIFFDSSDLFKEAPDYNLIIDFSYDPESGDCRIASISAKEKKPHSALDEPRYSVLIQDDSVFKGTVVSGGSPVHFNEYGQAVVYANDVDIKSENVRSEVQKVARGGNYDVVSLKYKPLKFRMKLHGSILPVSAYNVSSTYAGMNTSSDGFEGGLDIGFEGSPFKSVRTGLFIGGAVSSTRINLSANNVSYSYTAGDQGVRNYSFSATEDLSFLDFVVPLYLGTEIDIARWLMLDIDLGAKAYINYQTKPGDYKVTGNIAGQTVNQRVYSEFISPTDCTRENFEASVFANLEFDFRIVRRLLYAYLSAGYEYGLTPSFNNGGKTYLNEAAGVYPFVYSAATQDDVPYRSLVGSIEFNRRAILLSIGLKFKL